MTDEAYLQRVKVAIQDRLLAQQKGVGFSEAPVVWGTPAFDKETGEWRALVPLGSKGPLVVMGFKLTMGEVR